MPGYDVMNQLAATGFVGFLFGACTLWFIWWVMNKNRGD